jgi:hypothetical protein
MYFVNHCVVTGDGDGDKGGDIFKMDANNLKGQ